MRQAVAALAVFTAAVAVATLLVIFGLAPSAGPGSWHAPAAHAAWALAPYVVLLAYSLAARRKLARSQARISRVGAAVVAAFGLLLIFDVNGFTSLFIPLWQLCVCAVVATLNAAIR